MSGVGLFFARLLRGAPVVVGHAYAALHRNIKRAACS